MDPVTVVVKPKGTILIQGEIVVRDPEGRIIQPPPAKTPGVTKFCGCGRSKTRPFCDGSHNDVDR